MNKESKPSGVFNPEYLKNINVAPSMERAKELAKEYEGRKKIKNLYDTSVCARCGEKQDAQVCDGGKCSACGNGVTGMGFYARWNDYSE